MTRIITIHQNVNSDGKSEAFDKNSFGFRLEFEKRIYSVRVGRLQ